MRDPIFSQQRWRISVFTFLNRYQGRGRDRLREWCAKTVLTDLHYFKMAYRGDAHLWVCPRHWVGKRVLEDGTYEPFACSIIECFVRAGFGYMDAGANIGTHTVAAARARHDTAKIIAFEPFERSYKVLQENCRLNQLENVECVQAAVSDQSGEGWLIQPEADPGKVMTFESGSSADGDSAVRCRFVRLDDYLTDPAPNRPMLIKIDVQGAEPRVLLGGVKSLAARPELAILFEIDILFMTKAGLSVRDLIAALEPYQFERYFALFESLQQYQEITLADFEGALAQRLVYVNVLAVKGETGARIMKDFTAVSPDAARESQPLLKAW